MRNINVEKMLNIPDGEFEEGEMTVFEFVNFLNKNFKASGNGKSFTNLYVHTMCTYGHLPQHFGGNLLRVRKVRGVKVIKIMEEKFNFYSREYSYNIVGSTYFTDLDKKIGRKKKIIVNEGADINKIRNLNEE